MMHSGTIYDASAQPQDEFYKLTPEELRSMPVEGVPIRIEHLEGNMSGRSPLMSFRSRDCSY